MRAPGTGAGARLDARLVGLHQQNVLGLQVAVHDALLGHEAQCAQQLRRKAPVPRAPRRRAQHGCGRGRAAATPRSTLGAPCNADVPALSRQCADSLVAWAPGAIDAAGGGARVTVARPKPRKPLPLTNSYRLDHPRLALNLTLTPSRNGGGALDGGEAEAAEAVALDELVQADRQQLEHDAEVAAEVEVLVHAHDVPAALRVLPWAGAGLG